MKFDRPQIMLAPMIGIALADTALWAIGWSPLDMFDAMFGILIAWAIGWRPQQ
jgi:hypothetical protein